MKMIILAMLGTGSILCVMIFHGMILIDSKYQHELEDNLSIVMRQTMNYMTDKQENLEKDNKEIVQIMIQQLIARMDIDADVKVIFYQCDLEQKILDIELQAEYCLPSNYHRTASVRRKMQIES